MADELNNAADGRRGFFITFEGGEGAGKSTLVQKVADNLQAQGHEVVTLREPGGTALGENLRAILKNQHTSEPICAQAELLMMYASRVQLVNLQIKPALARGAMVLCDRHDLSSFAYQGGGRGLPFNTINQVRQAVLGDFTPDLTILIDVPVEVGMQRVRARGERDRFELEQLAFFERVRRAYLQVGALLPYVKIIDGTLNEKEVAAAAWQEICARLKER